MAALPEAVTFRQPRPVRDAPHVLELASYLLPCARRRRMVPPPSLSRHGDAPGARGADARRRGAAVRPCRCFTCNAICSSTASRSARGASRREWARGGRTHRRARRRRRALPPEGDAGDGSAAIARGRPLCAAGVRSRRRPLEATDADRTHARRCADSNELPRDGRATGARAIGFSRIVSRALPDAGRALARDAAGPVALGARRSTGRHDRRRQLRSPRPRAGPPGARSTPGVARASCRRAHCSSRRRRHRRPTTLVVFSQGLSPNALLAARARVALAPRRAGHGRHRRRIGWRRGARAAASWSASRVRTSTTRSSA